MNNRRFVSDANRCEMQIFFKTNNIWHGLPIVKGNFCYAAGLWTNLSCQQKCFLSLSTREWLLVLLCTHQQAFLPNTLQTSNRLVLFENKEFYFDKFRSSSACWIVPIQEQNSVEEDVSSFHAGSEWLKLEQMTTFRVSSNITFCHLWCHSLFSRKLFTIREGMY